MIDTVQRMSDPSELADAAGYAAWIETADKLRLLETADVAERLEFLLERAKAYLAEMEVSEKIASDVREGMEKSQREYLLRQQLAAIRKELGELSGDGDDAAEATTAAGSRRPTCPRPSARQPCARSTSSSAPSDQSPEARLDPHLARHRPRAPWGDPDHRHRPTSPPPAPSSTPTTPASTT